MPYETSGRVPRRAGANAKLRRGFLAPFHRVMLNPYLLIGEIVRPQGLRGEVKLRHFTDDPRRFEGLRSAFIKTGLVYEPRAIADCRVMKGAVYLTLEGVTDRDGAEKLRGIKLYVDREHARTLSGDEVFIADILGAIAYDTKRNTVGMLEDVISTGGTDVFVLKTSHGRMMLPALKTVILEMDPKTGEIVLDEQKLSEVALYEDRDSHIVPGNV